MKRCGPRLAGMAVCLGLLLISVSASAAEAIRFPEAGARAASPDGQYELVSEDDPDPAKDFPHRLLLVQSGKKTRTEILPYRRNVKVAWSPDSQFFFVTDFAGSDTAETYVFAVTDPEAPVGISQALRQDDFAQQLFQKNHHAYVEGLDWPAPGRMTLRFFGYGDEGNPGGFTIHYEYSVPEGLKLIRKEMGSLPEGP